MTPQELATLMLLLGEKGKPIEQAELGRLCYGKTERQVRRWLSGENGIPLYVASRVRQLAAVARKRKGDEEPDE
ncbi:MAG: hypothetical protein ACRENP_10700 [Longimicrobiales bacterium]